MARRHQPTPCHPIDCTGWVVCPITDVPIPKDPVENQNARDDLWLACAAHEEERDRWRRYCSQSCLVWINYWVYTYVVREVATDGTPLPRSQVVNQQPFVTWACQDDGIRVALECIEGGRDILFDKSRDMGASWLNVAIAMWYWLWHNDSQIIVTARIEPEVDKQGDPKTLYWKMDFLLANLPKWMLPAGTTYSDYRRPNGAFRSHMHLENPERNCTIEGQASTGHIGRAGRTLFVLFDEMASQAQATGGWRSAADTTSCRIGNSTPVGSGTEYTKQWQNGVQTGQPQIIGLYYYDHPQKGRGREWRVDATGEYTGTVGRGYWWSPWFEREAGRRDRQDIAQNILADHIISGDLYFDAVDITRMMQARACEPLRCELEDGVFWPDERGRWFVWCPLADGVPPQDTNYCAGSDPATGVGAANSCAAFYDRETGTLVAEFADPRVRPDVFADILIAAGTTVFAGQTGEAFQGWEINGPGASLYQVFLESSYSSCYYRRPIGKRDHKASREYGWLSSRFTKRTLLQGWGRGIRSGGVDIRSRACLNEALTYVYYEDGSIGPGHLRDETTGAREAHGDRVIAAAIGWMMVGEAPRFVPEAKRFEEGTFGAIDGHTAETRSVEPKDPFR